MRPLYNLSQSVSASVCTAMMSNMPIISISVFNTPRSTCYFSDLLCEIGEEVFFRMFISPLSFLTFSFPFPSFLFPPTPPPASPPHTHLNQPIFLRCTQQLSSIACSKTETGGFQSCDSYKSLSLTSA